MPASNTASTATLVGAGDIAVCGAPGAAMTAGLLAEIPGTVFTLGDNAYDTGSADEFARCYDPMWGRERTRTRPAMGNHDSVSASGAPYFAYFGDAAGPPGRGYYSYEAGAWHVVVLNSDCWIASCDAGGAQLRWLADDLAAHPGACTIAYWHHPFWSSGLHGPQPAVRAFVDALYAARADVVLSGHDHHYERFAPQDPAGRADTRGLRQFVVGTGGAPSYPVVAALANSERRISGALGVLRLTLSEGEYAWAFLTAGGRVLDEGSAPCGAAR